MYSQASLFKKNSAYYKYTQDASLTSADSFKESRPLLFASGVRKQKLSGLRAVRDQCSERLIELRAACVFGEREREGRELQTTVRLC